MVVTLTTRTKNWLAINAGVDNCFSPTGVTYSDPDGIQHTESTDRVVNAFWTAHQVGKDDAIIIANTDYMQFTAINNNVDVTLDDIDWVYQSSNHTNSTLPQYCAPPAHITSTQLLVPNACAPEPCTVDTTITWTNDGALTGGFQPGITVDGSTTVFSSESLAAGASISHTFTVSGLMIAGSPHAICAVPGPLCQNVSVFPILDICNWITSIGGWTKITAYYIMLLVDAYLTHINLGFTVKMQDINGAIAYYLGFLDSGNMFTGCAFT